MSLAKLKKDLHHNGKLASAGTVFDTDALKIEDEELEALEKANVFVFLTEEEAAFHRFQIGGVTEKKSALKAKTDAAEKVEVKPEPNQKTAEGAADVVGDEAVK